MSPLQKQRLEESAIRFILRRLANRLFPARTIGMPPIPGKTTKDGIMASTTLRMPFMDRLRAVLCGEIQITVMVACEQSPKNSVANINFHFLPPFIGSSKPENISQNYPSTRNSI